MTTMNHEELQAILAKHKAWLNDEAGGERANLSGANLRFANLRFANLSGANLSDANLSFNVFFGGSYGAPVYQACRGFGSRNATLTLLAFGEPSEWLFFTGCFRGTLAELEAAVAEKHGGTRERENYRRAMKYLWETALANKLSTN